MPEKPDAKKKVYLITFPHPNHERLTPPETFARSQIMEKVRDAFRNPVRPAACTGAAASSVAGGKPRKIIKMAIGREFHAKPDAKGILHTHDHVAILAHDTFRFLPVKRAL